MVPLEELQEAGLGACSTLHPPETQVFAGTLKVPHVHGQVLEPQTCSLTHCGQLGRPGRERERGGGEIRYRKVRRKVQIKCRGEKKSEDSNKNRKMKTEISQRLKCTEYNRFNPRGI
jgi:hypothetical protein